MIDALLVLLVFAASVSIDFANTRYVLAVGRLEAHGAARWSVVQWLASLAGFLVAIKYTLWMLPVEAAGLYAGAFISLHIRKCESDSEVVSVWHGDTSRTPSPFARTCSSTVDTSGPRGVQARSSTRSRTGRFL